MAIIGPFLVCVVFFSAFALPERYAKPNFNIDEEMAPKSFFFKYYRYPTLHSVEANFHEETLDFYVITPTLMFGYQQKEKVVKWNELKTSFSKNKKFNFDDLVSNFPVFKPLRKSWQIFEAIKNWETLFSKV